MRGITVKLEETTIAWLRAEASKSGRSVGALIREWVHEHRAESKTSVLDLTQDLAGCLAGSTASATNARTKFRRK